MGGKLMAVYIRGLTARETAALTMAMVRSGETLIDQVRRVGCAIAGQTADLVPADKRLYALRDVTATVESVPLIAASVMSKKIAGGAGGNAGEVEEPIATLRGEGPEDLPRLCLTLGAWMLLLAGAAASPAEAEERLRPTLDSGRALEQFRRMIEAQHGDPRVLDDLQRLPQARLTLPTVADRRGVVSAIDAQAGE